ncbi:MAG TPA: Hsp20/alpha crystallin family protein [Ginsengibacter sp.]
MLSSISPYHKISTYPGEYIPIQVKFETLAAELSKPHEGAKTPAYNISETQEYYKIELAVPGLQREDLFVSITNSGYLSISALHKEANMVEHEIYKKHTFNYECFNRELLLPNNIDTDFIKAEYRKGILSFWFLKTEKTYQKTASTVAVY